MTHTAKDCLERPRFKGAKWTSKGIAADELVEDLGNQSFEAKRDRWNGYSPDDWVRQAEKFEKIAEIRKEMLQKELLEEKFAGKDGVGDSTVAKKDEDMDVDEDEAEEDKVAEEESGSFAKLERRVRSAGGGATGTVRNLRIREDTAKYLLNLDEDSAYYDPKSRSMREDPLPNKDVASKTFAGENFVRESGAAQGFKALNLFSVTAFEKGQDVHVQATPSQAEAAYRAFKAKKEMLKNDTKSALLDKYGNVALAPTEETRAIRGTEAYAEYDATGRVIRGQETKAKSRYEEDVFPGNHTSVWGSWWHDGSWGYACCHQTMKNSYCTGARGHEAALKTAEEAVKRTDVAEQARGSLPTTALVTEDQTGGKTASQGGVDTASGARGDQEEHKATNTISASKPHHGIPENAALWGSGGESEPVLDKKKLQEAIARQEKVIRDGGEDMDDRKRRYNSMKESCDVTAEDMEAYRLKRERTDDPLTAVEAAKNNGASTASQYDYV